MRPTQHLAARSRLIKTSRGGSFKNDHYDRADVPLRADWHPINIHNLWQRNNGALQDQFDFSRSRDSLFKIFAVCKRHLREYWMPTMKDRHFRKWYLPNNLPVVHPTAMSSPTMVPSAKSITKWARPGKEGGRHAIESAELHSYLGAQAPTGPFMFRELERRMDHVLFRGGFADSLEAAREIIRRGAVRLNGNVEKQYLIRMLPGDFLEINPTFVPFLRRPPVEHIALAHDSSAGVSYDVREGHRTRLIELVGLTPAQAEFAIEADSVNFELVEKIWHRWTTTCSGDGFGAEMAGPLGQEEIKAVLGIPLTTESVRLENGDADLSLRERQRQRDEAHLTVEERAARRADEDAAGGGLYLTDADEPAHLPKQSPGSAIAIRSNANVKLTPSHFPALPSDPAGTRDFHLPPFSAPQLFVPAYLQPNYRYCTLAYIRHPQARHNYCEIPSPFDAKGTVMKRAWEWYRAHKIRSKTYAGGLYPGGIDARARKAYIRRGPETHRTGVHEDFY